MYRIITTITLTILTAFSSITAQNWWANPESVVYDEVGNRYFVSNYGNGSVVEINENGQYRYCATGLVHSYGMAIADNTLYISIQSDHVLGLDLTTADTVLFVSIPAINNLDGLTADTSGFLYVIDTGGRIYKINRSTGEHSLFVYAGLPTFPQDLVFDPANNRLLIGAYAFRAGIRQVMLPDSTVTTAVATDFGYFDGITIADDGCVYVASHSNDGEIYRFTPDFSDFELIASDLDQPSGLHYNNEEDVLAAPLFSDNTVEFLGIYADFEADVNVGWSPLEVSFDGYSRLTPDTWSWDFGDGGTADEASPVHVYTEPGIYDVILHTDSAGDVHWRRKPRHVAVLADTLIAADTALMGTGSFEIVVSATNTMPVNQIVVPVNYGGSLGLELDSFSVVGCRSEYFQNILLMSSEPANSRMVVKLQASVNHSAPDLPAGEGPVLRLFFTVADQLHNEDSTAISFDGYSIYQPRFYGEMATYQPILRPGWITYAGCCVGIRGNLDSDPLEEISIADLVYMVEYMFSGGPEPLCAEEGDIDGAGGDPAIGIDDLVYLVEYMFGGGPYPASCP